MVRGTGRPWIWLVLLFGVVVVANAVMVVVAQRNPARPIAGDPGDGHRAGGSGGGAEGPGPGAEDSLYIAEIDRWHAEREARLREPDGWLTLCGLHWLSDGENPIGSAPGSRVGLPPGKAPERVGFLRVANGKVRIEVASGVPVTRDGAPVRELDLVTDAESEPTILALGSLRFHVISRGGRLAVRVRDLEHPALREFRGVPRYPVDPDWRIEGRLAPYDPPRTIEVPDVTGQVNRSECPGAIEFPIDGRMQSLDVIEASEDGYFLVFGDLTNGRETYGGGRFLAVDPADDKGRVVVDFNRAYNPPCAFTPYATCPLPPAQNILPVAVTAGELAHGSGHH